MGNVERLPLRHLGTGSVAVLLNANARSVTTRLRRELENFVPKKDLFFSRSFDEARKIARTVLDRGYQTVLTGGGDGTFVGYVNCFYDLALAAAQEPSISQAALKLAPVPAGALRLPRIGTLKLGTGNAVADFAGASGRRSGVASDILRVRSGEVTATRSLHLLSHEGKRAPFAGLGIDAALLNDYCRLKQRLAGTRMSFLGTGGMGYFCSIVGKTIPSYALSSAIPNAEVINLGGPAEQLDPEGKPTGRIIYPGEVIYRGPCKIAAAGTVPNYGFGFQIFPHALSSPGRFQLRLAAIGVPRILRNLRTFWKGGAAPEGVLDFHCDRVLIKFDREMPLQVGGDAEGYRREVLLSMAERPLELLDFQPRALAVV
ncbi:MAG TPA: diacylglycerol kinase family protein [Myxococcales bacterium]|jgi:diacylglycerol kinase family enzyme